MNSNNYSLMVDAESVQQLEVDGLALKIKLYQQAPRLFPFKRLSRIHVVGKLNAHLNTLIHCAEQDIVVSFFSRRGELRAQLLTPEAEKSILADWIEHVEFDSEVSNAYSSWLSDNHSHELAEIRKITGIPFKASEIFKDYVAEELVSRFGEKLASLVDSWAQGLLTATLSALIHSYGLTPGSHGHRRILMDIMPICSLRHMTAVLESTSTLKPCGVCPKIVARIHHQNLALVEMNAKRMLIQFIQRLERIV